MRPGDAADRMEDRASSAAPAVHAGKRGQDAAVFDRLFDCTSPRKDLIEGLQGSLLERWIRRS